jgi:hypothetical protein
MSDAVSIRLWEPQFRYWGSRSETRWRVLLYVPSSVQSLGRIEKCNEVFGGMTNVARTAALDVGKAQAGVKSVGQARKRMEWKGRQVGTAYYERQQWQRLCSK